MNNRNWIIGGIFCILWISLLIINTEPIPNSEDLGQTSTNKNVLSGSNERLNDSSEHVNEDVLSVIEPIAMDRYYYTSQENHYIQVQSKQVPLIIKQINMNYSKGVTIKPKYIVIHETNNYSVGADANAHYRYWSTNPTAEASTHFVVDNREIYQMLELDQAAWHVGDRPGYSDINNFNSIGIEIAVNADGNYEEARYNAIQLTVNLMKYLDMDISQLKRHYDATGKWCPTIMLEDPSLWDDFVRQVEYGLTH